MSSPAFPPHLPLPELSPESLEFIRSHSELIPVKGNAVLVRPGKVCDRAFLVLQGGFVCRYIQPEQDVAKTINFYLEDLHPFMACVDSYFTQTPTECELRAIAPSIVLAMRKKDIDALLDKDAGLQRFYQELVITALTEENDLKLKIIAYRSEELYRYIVRQFPAVIRRVPSKYIAELMGISAEWLSKLKKQSAK